MSSLANYALFVCISVISSVGHAQENPLTADSREQPNVPKGEIRGPFEFRSTVFPGTIREYWVYVPDQYSPDRPACTLVVQDGLNCAESWKLPTVLDNLIHKKEIPVMVGVFVQWGRTDTGEGKLVRYNRSFEYDALGDRYARFLIDELLPAVSKNYNLSANPNDRMIAGQSSGAICAFNAAWERPDVFRRVYSGIGTYVGLRGGDELATLIRKQEPKPLRIFLEDGSNDLDIYAGGWWTANQSMLAALEWAGYEVEHNWGTGGHNGQHTASILPDALRWLWKEYPKPVESHGPKENRVSILLPTEKWTDLGISGREITCLATGSTGELFLYDSRVGTIIKRNLSGDLIPYASYNSALSKMSFGSDGNLYAIDPHLRKVVRFTPNGKHESLLTDIEATSLLLTQGGIYLTETDHDRITHYDFKTRKKAYSEVRSPACLGLFAEQTFLFAAGLTERLGYSFRIASGGTLEFGQPYIHYHMPYGEVSVAPMAMAQDNQGLLYTLTSMGIQVTDQLGRVNLIVELPDRSRYSDMSFGGNGLNEMYVLSENGRVFKRVINAKGVLPWQAPVQPPKPGL